MSTTESVGGKCPVCGYKRMLLRYSSRSNGWYQFDACPNCTFAYATNGFDEGFGKEVWDNILSYYSETLSSKALPISINGLKRLVEQEQSDDDLDKLIKDTVFQYDLKDLEDARFFALPIHVVDTLRIFHPKNPMSEEKFNAIKQKWKDEGKVCGTNMVTHHHALKHGHMCDICGSEKSTNVIFNPSKYPYIKANNRADYLDVCDDCVDYVHYGIGRNYAQFIVMFELVFGKRGDNSE